MSTARRPATIADTPNHREEVAIIRRELLDLQSPDEDVRRLALATIQQSVHMLNLMEPATDVPARLTHDGNGLLDRYRV